MGDAKHCLGHAVVYRSQFWIVGQQRPWPRRLDGTIGDKLIWEIRCEPGGLVGCGYTLEDAWRRLHEHIMAESRMDLAWEGKAVAMQEGSMMIEDQSEAEAWIYSYKEA